MRRAVVLALALAACTPAPFPAPPPTAPEGDCGAEALQGLVGRPAAVLQTMKFAGPVRIIRPGEPVTADYSAVRLNFEIDAAEVIARVVCG